MDMYEAMRKVPSEIRAQLREEMMGAFPDLSWGKPFDCIDRIAYALAAVNFDLIEWNAENAELVKDAAGTILGLYLESGMSMDAFMKTRMGYVTNQSWLWAHQDAMISIPEASELTSLSELTLSILIDHGNLKSFIDPFEKDPKQATRVVRSRANEVADNLSKNLNLNGKY